MKLQLRTTIYGVDGWRVFEWGYPRKGKNRPVRAVLK